MEEKLISFETATLAFEKGFPQEPNKLRVPYYNYKGEIKGDVTEFLKRHLKNEDTTGYENVSAPTQSLLQKWLREVHKINVESNYLPNVEKYGCLYIPMSGKAKPSDLKYVDKRRFDKYEEALEVGLQKALKQIN